MNKVEALKKLRDKISQQTKLANGEYITNESESGNVCSMCVVGHLFHMGGASEAQLAYLDAGAYTDGDYSIDAIFDGAYSREHIDRNDNFVKYIFEELGFNVSNHTLPDYSIFTRLQQINDDSNGDVHHVLNAIDDEIRRIELSEDEDDE